MDYSRLIFLILKKKIENVKKSQRQLASAVFFSDSFVPSLFKWGLSFLFASSMSSNFLSSRFFISFHKKASSPGAENHKRMKVNILHLCTFIIPACKFLYWTLHCNLPITDIKVETAVSVASIASSKTFGEHDASDVIENPTGL